MDKEPLRLSAWRGCQRFERLGSESSKTSSHWSVSLVLAREAKLKGLVHSLIPHVRVFSRGRPSLPPSRPAPASDPTCAERVASDIWLLAARSFRARHALALRQHLCPPTGPLPRLNVSTVNSHRAEAGLRECPTWCPRMNSTEGTINLCHILPALPSWGSKGAQTSLRPAACPQQEVPPLARLRLGRSCSYRAARPAIGQPGCQRPASPAHCEDSTLAQRYFFRGNGVDRATHNQSGLNYSWGHWGICSVTCGLACNFLS